jgi:hypothetical protein
MQATDRYGASLHSHTTMDFYAMVSTSSNRKNDGVPPVDMMPAGSPAGIEPRLDHVDKASKCLAARLDRNRV